jgi:hypothetical protein
MKPTNPSTETLFQIVDLLLRPSERCNNSIINQREFMMLPAQASPLKNERGLNERLTFISR